MILADVLAEAWLSSGPELARNAELRRAVLLRIAAAPVSSASTSALSRFDSREVAGIAWQALGGSRSQINLSHAFVWCRDQGEISPGYLLDRLKAFESLTPMSLSELIYIMHASFPIECLRELTRFTPIYTMPGPTFPNGRAYVSQLEIAMQGLGSRVYSPVGDKQNKVESTELASSEVEAVDTILKTIFRVLATLSDDELRKMWGSMGQFEAIANLRMESPAPTDGGLRSELARLATILSMRLSQFIDAEEPTSRTLSRSSSIWIAARLLKLWAAKWESGLAIQRKQNPSSEGRQANRGRRRKYRREGRGER